jgi:hypothetical protein
MKVEQEFQKLMRAGNKIVGTNILNGRVPTKFHSRSRRS